MFRLFLFGSPVLTKDQEPIHIRRKRSMALLAYIAMQERPQSREALATLIWPDNDQSSAYGNLRRELARLKADVGDGLIYADRQSIGIEHDADLWVDVKAFESEIDREDLDAVGEKLGLYTDSFMVGLALPDSPAYDEWQFYISEDLRTKYSTMLQTFMAAQAQAQDFDSAVETARHWLQLDNLNEPAHRSLMRYYALAGHYSAAIRQYHICVRILETELGVKPDPETEALLTAIQSKQIGPVPTKPAELTLDAVEPVEKAAVIRHNIPAFPDTFVGRGAQIEEIITRLTQSDGRLLTLRGIGGIGKTRLAVQAVTALIDTGYFPDGLFFVDLAGVESEDFLIPAIAETLNFPLSKSTEPIEQLSNFLQDKALLLLLDNFEHLQKGAHQLTKILQKCPKLKLLVTSRHQLNLAGEVVLVLDGLPLPQSQKRSSEAVQLFQDRARQFALQLDFGAERLFIEAICRLVGGMPLAIEMCAAWVYTLSCQEILAEIHQGLTLLESGRIDVPERHQSIRAVFLSSFNLLNPGEQQVLLKLAIFQGGFTRSAAEEVAGARLMQLRSLVEKSLLNVRGQQTVSRYQMHQLLRQYVLEKISAEKLNESRQRHARYFANLLAELDKLRLTAENEKIITTVFVEMDNLRSIWRWLGRQIEAGETPGLVCDVLDNLLPAWSFAYTYKTFYLEGKQLLSIVWDAMQAAGWEESAAIQQQRTFAIISAVLSRTYVELGQFEDAIEYSQRALAILRSLPAETSQEQEIKAENISYALRSWGVSNFRMGSLEESEKHLIEAVETAPNDITKAWAMHALGTLYSNSARYDAALSYFNPVLPMFERLNDKVGVLAANIAIGSVYGRQRMFEEAIPRYREVVRMARQLEQKGLLMMALNNLADCLHKVGQMRQVAEFFEESLALAKETGNKRWQSMIAQAFGFIQLDQGETQKAERNIRDGLELAIELKSQPDVLAGLFPMAQLQAQTGHFEEALIAVGFLMNNQTATGESRLYATDLWEELSSELPPIFTQRAQAKLKNATLDDVLQMLPV